MGLVGSWNFLKIQRLFHLTFEVMVTSLTSHAKGLGGTPYRNSSFWKNFFAHHFRVKGECFWEWKIQKNLIPYWFWCFDVSVVDQGHWVHNSLTVTVVVDHNRMSVVILSRLWDIKKKFTPGKCPCWGHVFGSEKFQKSQPESRFSSKHDIQKSSFFIQRWKCAAEDQQVESETGQAQQDVS